VGRLLAEWVPTAARPKPQLAYGYDTAWNTGASTWILRSGCPAALAPTAVGSPACGGFLIAYALLPCPPACQVV
jgi:hypothetical protein